MLGKTVIENFVVDDLKQAKLQRLKLDSFSLLLSGRSGIQFRRCSTLSSVPVARSGIDKPENLSARGFLLQIAK